MDLLELARHGFPLNLKIFSMQISILFTLFGFVVDLCSWIENFGEIFFLIEIDWILYVGFFFLIHIRPGCDPTQFYK